MSVFAFTQTDARIDSAAANHGSGKDAIAEAALGEQLKFLRVGFVNEIVASLITGIDGISDEYGGGAEAAA